MRSMTIGKKLIIAACVVMVLVGLLALATMAAQSSMKANFDTAVEKTVWKLSMAHSITKATADMMIGHRGTLLYSYRKDPTTMQANYDTFEAKLEETLRLTQKSRALLVTQQEKDLVSRIEQQLKEWKQYESQDLQFCLTGDMEATTALGKKIVPLHQAIDKVAMELLKLEEDDLQKLKAEAGRDAVRSRWTALIVTVLVLCVGASLVWLAVSLSKMLRQLTKDLSDESDQVASAATQMLSASQSLAQGASEQAASLEETSSSTEEINSMTHQNAANSEKSVTLMAHMSNQVTEGNRKLDEMVASMQEISRSSDKISKIIKTIDEIAFQTNLLALNAAVEAARAGEAGMGFAVVADEVRSLAQRSAQAAKDTASLIEESISKSAEGGQKLDHVAKAIAGITGDAEKVKTLVDEVHVGSQEQARGLDQIAKAIAQMEQVTQKTAASAEQSAAAGQEVKGQAEVLRGLVRRLTEFVGGDGRYDAPAQKFPLHPRC